jgi:competence protein ComEA
MRKYLLSEYFSFSKKERTGIIALLSLIVFFLLLPLAFPLFIQQKQYSDVLKELPVHITIKKDSIRSVYEDDHTYHDYNKPIEKPISMFYFDPNTLDKTGWEKLGIRDKTIATIQNYLSKGGKFYKPDDIKKIWGLHDDDVQRLLPYVQIQSAVVSQSSKYIPYEKKKAAPSFIDINTADTTAFIALPGIGSKLANRIVEFRNKLGGFYKIDQIAETYALPDSTFQLIRPRLQLNDPTVKQININTATLDELKVHPYIRYYIANAIIQYRNQHGSFSSIDDLKKILLITDDAFTKMKPYLKIVD